MRLIKFKYIIYIILIINIIGSIFVYSKDNEQDGYKQIMEKPQIMEMYLKGRSVKNIVIYEMKEGQGPIEIRIKDKDVKQAPTRICIPTRYAWGKIGKIKLFDDRDIIGVKFYGLTGTDQAQIIEMWIGYCQSRYRPIFFETLSYRSCAFMLCLYELVYNIHQIEGKIPFIQMYNKYKEIVEAPFPYKKTIEWEEKLTWSEETCSFYDPEKEKEKSESAYSYLERNQARIRLGIYHLNLNETCLKKDIEKYYLSIIHYFDLIYYDHQFCETYCRKK